MLTLDASGAAAGVARHLSFGPAQEYYYNQGQDEDQPESILYKYSSSLFILSRKHASHYAADRACSSMAANQRWNELAWVEPWTPFGN